MNFFFNENEKFVGVVDSLKNFLRRFSSNAVKISGNLFVRFDPNETKLDQCLDDRNETEEIYREILVDLEFQRSFFVENSEKVRRDDVKISIFDREFSSRSDSTPLGSLVELVGLYFREKFSLECDRMFSKVVVDDQR